MKANDFFDISNIKGEKEETLVASQNFLLDSDLGTIRFALNKLKDNYQEVIICHYIDDLSVSETAKMLNKSEGAVRVMVHRALKALKNEVDKQQKEV